MFLSAHHGERFFILSYTFPRHPQQHPLTVLPPIPHSFETSTLVYVSRMKW